MLYNFDRHMTANTDDCSDAS